MQPELPNLLANWPSPGRVNPLQAEVVHASDNWVSSLNVLCPTTQEVLNACKFGRLASMLYPFADAKQLRRGCDLMNVFFLIDDLTESMEVSQVEQATLVIMDAFNNPQNPPQHGEDVIGKIIQQFWLLTIDATCESWQQRFIAAFQRYMDSVVQQAKWKYDHVEISDIDAYMAQRRENIGGWPSVVLLELDFKLPSKVYDHPLILELCGHAIEMVALDNDMISFNVEQNRGDNYNVLCVVMKALSLDLTQALDWVARKRQDLAQSFLSNLTSLPTFGEEYDGLLMKYLSAVAQLVTGNFMWSLECERYRGNKGPIILPSREIASRNI